LEFDDLLADVLRQLPEDRGNVVAALREEFNVGADIHFVLGIVAGCTKRQRQIVRLLLNDLEKLEIARGGSKSS
tara:strand:+ start:68 stop:289 length:222 start_codon:yes stop_codon:yes gene_type:complete